MDRNIYYLPQVQSILTHLTNYNVAQHIIKNYTIDETTEKYQNVIDQLQFLHLLNYLKFEILNI
jgi:hypothetical protein